jgi:hypothetical protein
MVRAPLTPWERERERGERLGTLLRRARGSRSMAEVAAACAHDPDWQEPALSA